MVNQTADAIVIGGGIAGCAAAYFLAREGRSVTLIEKDAVASHASGKAFGELLPEIVRDANDPTADIVRGSLATHRLLGEQLAERVRAVRREKAAVLVADSDHLADQYRQLYRNNSDLIGDVRWLEHGELSHIEARISPEVRGGLYLGDAAEIDPHQFTSTLWQAAEQAGAVLVNAEVLDIRDDGPNGATVSTGTSSFTAPVVVVAAGPWSGALLQRVGITVPVEPLKGQIVRLEVPATEMRVSLWWGGDYATSKPDGLFWCGTTEERVGFNEEPTQAAQDSIIASAARILPLLAQGKVIRHTACLRPVSGDGMPVIGRLNNESSIVVATGGGRNGMVLGPGLGRCAADIATGQKPSFNVSRLGPSRFLR